MNPREQRLLIVFGLILFVVVNFYGYSLFSTKMTQLEGTIGKDATTFSDATGLKEELETALRELDERDSKQKEIDWLEQATPEPKEGGTVQSQLQVFTTGRARSIGLTVDRPKILPNDEDGEIYHRALFQIKVSGQEKALYAWLAQLQSPRDFRAVTKLKLYPNREDDTLIDAEVQVEQWYLPADFD